MNIQEKFNYMNTSKLYNDLDPLLLKSRQKSVQKTTKLNNESNSKLKEKLFRELVGSAGKSPSVKPNFRCEFGRNIHVGNNFYANYDCIILDGAKVTIGDKNWLGANVTVTPETNIGERTIIVVDSVVTHSIPSNVIAAGNPYE